MNHSSIRIIVLSFVLILVGCNNRMQNEVEPPQTETPNSKNQNTQDYDIHQGANANQSKDDNSTISDNTPKADKLGDPRNSIVPNPNVIDTAEVRLRLITKQMTR